MSAQHAAPQIGKGVGIIGKTLIRHGNDFQKNKFLPMVLNADVEFAVGYSEPEAGSDAANMQLKAEKVEGGWMLNGQKMWTTSAHFADWYWVGARTDPDKKKHDGLSLFRVNMDNNVAREAIHENKIAHLLQFEELLQLRHAYEQH